MCPERKTKTCPYLGLIADPDTISAEADPVNHCYLQKPPQSVEVDYQNNYCLSGKFTECDIYSEFVTQSLVTAGIIPVAEAENELEVSQEIDGSKDVDEIKDEEIRPVDLPSEQEEIALSNRRDDEWRRKLHQEAQSKYNNVSEKRQGRGLWAVLFIVAIVILGVSVYGILNALNTAKAQVNNGSDTSGESLANTIEGMNSAANAWATAAAAIEGGQDARATNQAATSTVVYLQAQQALEATVRAAQEAVVMCGDVNETAFVIVQGPMLEPNPGYQYVDGSDGIDIESSWEVENTGNCNWESIQMFSLTQRSIVTPTLRVNGESVNLANPDGKVLVQPQDRIEIVVPYDLEQAENVEEEYVLVVNGLTLFNQPQLILDVEGWVIITRPTSAYPARATATPTPKSSSGGSDNDGPTRPTPVDTEAPGRP